MTKDIAAIFAHVKKFEPKIKELKVFKGS